MHPIDSAASSEITPPARVYRRLMKPRLPRKLTSSARINLNRFWNELEEFYDRNPLPAMPAYTTDVWDHRREEAENRLNEKIERAAEQQKKQQENKTPSGGRQQQPQSRLRLQSLEVDEGIAASSSEDEDEDDHLPLSPSSPLAFWSLLEPASEKLPSPPSQLPKFLF